jgi:hypothetical protein
MRLYLLALSDLSIPAICIVPKLFRISGQLVSALAGRLQASQKKVSPYCEVTALKPSGRRTTIIRSPFFDCDRCATPVDAQFGHLKISVQCPEMVMEAFRMGSVLSKRNGPNPGEELRPFT